MYNIKVKGLLFIGNRNMKIIYDTIKMFKNDSCHFDFYI